MLIGLGHDLQRVGPVGSSAHLRAEGAVFTAGELAYAAGAKDPAATLTGLFAAKEALFKALPPVWGCYWTDVEVTHAPSGAPGLTLHGRAAEAARGAQLLVSISHADDLAAAVVVAWRAP
jgi:holo-[acyl-carrier protein] synthase